MLKKWSRKGRCPVCGVGTGSHHQPSCTWYAENIQNIKLPLVKYLVIGGTVISKLDGQEHYVNARELCRLYQIDPRECILMEETDSVLKTRAMGLKRVIILRPRYDGNYTLPTINLPE